MKSWHVIILCVLCSCGTSKRSTETERHVSTNVVVSDSICRKDSSTIIERILSNESLRAHIIITELSKPDSIGKQYPTKTTEINLDGQKSEQADKHIKSGSEGLQVKKHDLSSNADEKVKEDVKKDSRPIPTWVWCFMVVGGVMVVLFFLYMRMERY